MSNDQSVVPIAERKLKLQGPEARIVVARVGAPEPDPLPEATFAVPTVRPPHNARIAKPTLRLALTIAVGLMLVACLYSGTHINSANVSRVRVCQTRKSDIIRLFGQPDTTGVVHGLQYWQWASASNNQICTGGLDAQWLNVVMDQNDLVVDLAFNPPDSYAPSNTCAH